MELKGTDDAISLGQNVDLKLYKTKKWGRNWT